MADKQKKSLRQITLNDENIFISAIIIGKSEPTIFVRNENFHGVLQLTVRDSRLDFCTCKIWGNKEKIDEYNRKFHLNNLINIICPRVKPLQQDKNSPDQKYQPITTTTFSLIIQEGFGYLEHLANDDNLSKNILKSLISMPIKSLNCVMSLADICLVGGQDVGQLVDLLVCVRRLKPIKEIESKINNNKIMKCLELVVIDKSLSSGMALTIWNNEWIDRATQFWQPLKTILHLIDIRVSYSNYYKSTVLGLSQKSLIFENLNGKEIDILRFFAQNTELPDDSRIFSNESFYLPSADSITTVMTVQQIYDCAFSETVNNSDQFTAVLLATITKFDLDGFSKIIGRKCKSCLRRLLNTQIECENEQCQMSFSFGHSDDKFEYFFDINLHLTDHTGTLIETRITNEIAEKCLNIHINEFMKLNVDEKSELKWKFLMEKFNVKLLVKKKSMVRNNIAVIVIDLNEITIDEVVEKILVY